MSNPNTKELLNVLQHNYNPDYWSDEVLHREAAPLARKLSAADWLELAAQVPTQSAAWCSRLADTAISTHNEVVFPALVAMLRHQDAEAGVAAAEALISVDYLWDPNESLLADIDRHLASNPSYPAPLRRLRNRLPS